MIFHILWNFQYVTGLLQKLSLILQISNNATVINKMDPYLIVIIIIIIIIINRLLQTHVHVHVKKYIKSIIQGNTTIFRLFESSVIIHFTYLDQYVN